MIKDTRPRYPYSLPSGEIVRVIYDHGNIPKPTITYQLADRSIVLASLVSFPMPFGVMR